MWQYLTHISGTDVIYAVIGITVILFIVAIIRYLFDRSGGYF